MASEEVFNGEFENGNSSDLKMATDIATRMVTLFGMSSLGFARIDDKGNMADKINTEVNIILNECYQIAKDIITNNKVHMTHIINHLFKNKELTGDEFMGLVKMLENKKK